uniref:Uncharacterized protein n=1 Tax=Arundo donax TaxID=35708 RepID=A0A0A9ETZ0_ARUDO
MCVNWAGSDASPQDDRTFGRRLCTSFYLYSNPRAVVFILSFGLSV